VRNVGFISPQTHPFILSLRLSVLFAIVGALLGWGCSRLLQAIAAHRDKASQTSRNQSAVLTGSQPGTKGKTK
jgi:hypothetical protein